MLMSGSELARLGVCVYVCVCVCVYVCQGDGSGKTF